MLAAEHGHTTTVHALITAGADANHQSTKDGGTALMRAASKGHSATVQALVASGAQIDHENKVT